MLSDILGRHRGPYRFCVSRPGKRVGFYRSEWLAGCTDSDDVGTEAMALLSDPRDTISSVGVWSVREEQFVTSIRGEEDL